MKYYKYTWDNFDRDMSLLTRRIKYAKFVPKTLVALARGGLPAGVKLSHKLHAPLLIMSAKSYSKEQQGNLAFNVSFTRPMESPILLIDDITDTGVTMKAVYEYITSMGLEVKTATLFYKKRSTFRPDWYLNEVGNPIWVKFCWE